MNWRDHLKPDEAAVLREFEDDRDDARSIVAFYSEGIRTIRNTCIQRARRAKEAEKDAGTEVQS